MVAQKRRIEPVDEPVFPEGPVDDELPAVARIFIAAESPFHPQGENGNRTISPRNKGVINIPPVQLPHLG